MYTYPITFLFFFWLCLGHQHCSPCSTLFTLSIWTNRPKQAVWIRCHRTWSLPFIQQYIDSLPRSPIYFSNFRRSLESGLLWIFRVNSRVTLATLTARATSQLIRLLYQGCTYKFTYLMTNSADPDQLASEEANWYRPAFCKGRAYLGPADPWLIYGNSQFGVLMRNYLPTAPFIQTCPGWSGVAKVSCFLRHQGVQMILAYTCYPCSR